MAGKLKNCRGCGKLFMSTGDPFCHDCLTKQSADEERIIEYVRKNPECTVTDIVNALGIAEGVVRRLVERGRLFQAGIDYFYPCRLCGAPIVSGQYCRKCAGRLKSEIVDEQFKRGSKLDIQ